MKAFSSVIYLFYSVLYNLFYTERGIIAFKERFNTISILKDFK
jgi:hypothetical protein